MRGPTEKWITQGLQKAALSFVQAAPPWQPPWVAIRDDTGSRDPRPTWGSAILRILWTSLSFVSHLLLGLRFLAICRRLPHLLPSAGGCGWQPRWKREARWQVAGLTCSCSRAAGRLAEALTEPPESALVCALGRAEDEHGEAGKIPIGVGCSLRMPRVWEHLCGCVNAGLLLQKDGRQC